MTAALAPWRFRERSALGGFWPAYGFTVFYLSLIVIAPLAALVLKPWEIGLDGVWKVVSSPRVNAALKLSFGAAALAAALNAVFGAIVAWVLVRYEFPGKRIIDALVENPATANPAEQARAIAKAREAALADPEGKALGGALGRPVTWLKPVKS